MTQEEKFLLFQDLCARLPYHPKGHVVNACNGAECDEWLTCATFTMFTNITNNSRLYLRPMSSMTEEEWQEYRDINYCLTKDCDAWNEVDWLNAHQFDYRGLIEKGLAIEAPEGMYDLNNK
jgi:hypothetical protein